MRCERQPPNLRQAYRLAAAGPWPAAAGSRPRARGRAILWIWCAVDPTPPPRPSPRRGAILWIWFVVLAATAQPWLGVPPWRYRPRFWVWDGAGRSGRGEGEFRLAGLWRRDFGLRVL
ncbi:hypothetical protein Ate02nite_67630 [Paractinoplanes tereljensis]|uniref:Uncharacterized protein n=1 Tax=Paractinoplanes tereljensis TaxID=571912 RepID=A0A919TUT5_9ACTN|nr:hypothetical protein Ate02nite_67630 [Actinoplanes tereljensis]